MISPISPRRPRVLREWLRRTDRIVRDLNVLLVFFAIGLAVLDTTFLVTQHIVARLPELTRVVYVGDPPASDLPADRSAARRPPL